MTAVGSHLLPVLGAHMGGHTLRSALGHVVYPYLMPGFSGVGNGNAGDAYRHDMHVFCSMKVGAGCSPRGETHLRLKHIVRLVLRVCVWVEPTGYRLLNTPFLLLEIGRLDARGCSMYSVVGGRAFHAHDGRRLWWGLRSFAIGAGAPTRHFDVTVSDTIDCPSTGAWIFASPGKWIFPSTGA